jgi:hypothetical protein
MDEELFHRRCRIIRNLRPAMRDEKESSDTFHFSLRLLPSSLTAFA